MALDIMLEQVEMRQFGSGYLFCFSEYRGQHERFKPEVR
jgi:hypothetical protein